MCVGGVLQVHWNSLSRTYWVHWHMVEILGEGPGASADKDSQEVSSALTETLKLTAGEYSWTHTSIGNTSTTA